MVFVRELGLRWHEGTQRDVETNAAHTVTFSTHASSIHNPPRAPPEPLATDHGDNPSASPPAAGASASTCPRSNMADCPHCRQPPLVTWTGAPCSDPPSLTAPRTSVRVALIRLKRDSLASSAFRSRLAVIVTPSPPASSDLGAAENGRPCLGTLSSAVSALRPTSWSPSALARKQSAYVSPARTLGLDPCRIRRYAIHTHRYAWRSRIPVQRDRPSRDSHAHTCMHAWA